MDQSGTASSDMHELGHSPWPSVPAGDVLRGDGFGQAMGDKTRARRLAEECNVPVVPGSEGEVQSAADAMVFARDVSFPVMLKAAHGGGGRGMRVVRAGAGLIWLSRQLRGST